MSSKTISTGIENLTQGSIGRGADKARHLDESIRWMGARVRPKQPDQDRDRYRVLVWTPAGPDASSSGANASPAGGSHQELIQQVLSQSAIPWRICENAGDLCDQIRAGSGAVLVTDEALSAAATDGLMRALRDQPSWSDIPLLILTGGNRNIEAILKTIGTSANVMLLERPARMSILRSTIRSALRARRRQYEVRDLLGKLEETDRQKDLFLATLSHELRTPLTAVLGWIRLMRSEKLDLATLDRGLQAIERNTRVQSHLIEDILSVSRIITGKLEIQQEEVDLASIAQSAVETLRPTAELQHIAIRETIPPSPVTVSGDAARLHQVIWNLLSNAVKFTSEGGQVSVLLEQAGSNVRLVIRDTGRGIDSQFLPYVFDHFSQADSTCVRGLGGLGLGLAIVHHLVRLHDGSIRAESDGPGKGATFTVSLPCLRQRALEGTPAPADAADIADGANELEGLRILLVEDHAESRGMISALLEHSGAQVISVGSAAEAIRSFRFSKPDLIVSDIGLPEQDGYELMRELVQLQLPGSVRIPAIALTGYVSPADKQKALEAGYSLHLVKPIDSARLLAGITSVLETRSTGLRKMGT